MSSPGTDQLLTELQEARRRLFDLVEDLNDEQMMGPRLPIVNPLRWEIAHVAFFQEFWLLHHLRGFKPIEPLPHLDPDNLYDSARVVHNSRWGCRHPREPILIGAWAGASPWFGDHKVLRGECWATRSRLIRKSHHNFYKPDRRDVSAGRTCRLRIADLR